MMPLTDDLQQQAKEAYHEWTQQLALDPMTPIRLPYIVRLAVSLGMKIDTDEESI